MTFAALVVAADIPLCGFSAVAGIPCPLCGGSRAFASLGTLDFASAWRYCPGVVVGLGFAAVHTGFLLIEALLGVCLGWAGLWRSGWKAVVVVVTVAWAWRLGIG
jgi:hypothetical protein